jgi:hypothetical protein
MQDQFDLLLHTDTVETSVKPLVDNRALLFLPALSEKQASVPRDIGRSGVFSAADNSDNFVDGVVIYKDENRSLLYKGQTLGQDEADVFLTVIRHMQNMQIGEETKLKLSKNKFLEMIGWTKTGANHVRLTDAMTRLRAALFLYDTEHDSGVHKKTREPFNMFMFEQKETHIEVWIPERSAELFKQNSILSWEKRTQIAPKKTLAKAIQVYLSTFDEKDIEFTFKDLRETTGVKSPDNKFSIALDQALQELVRVGVIVSFWIEKRLKADGTKRKDWWCGITKE